MSNIYTATQGAKSTEVQILGRPLTQVLSRLDALLLVLKSCKGSTCIQPWDVLQPSDGVRTFRDAMNETYDGFYAQQPRVSFDWCGDGYFIEAEGPQSPLTRRYGLPWDAWV